MDLSQLDRVYSQPIDASYLKFLVFADRWYFWEPYLGGDLPSHADISYDLQEAGEEESDFRFGGRVKENLTQFQATTDEDVPLTQALLDEISSYFSTLQLIIFNGEIYKLESGGLVSFPHSNESVISDMLPEMEPVGEGKYRLPKTANVFPTAFVIAPNGESTFTDDPKVRHSTLVQELGGVSSEEGAWIEGVILKDDIYITPHGHSNYPGTMTQQQRNKLKEFSEEYNAVKLNVEGFLSDPLDTQIVNKLSNYISDARETLEESLIEQGENPEDWGDNWEDLLDLYVLLLQVKGDDVTLEDVHESWSIFTDKSDPEHDSLIPFDELTEEVQSYDEPFQKAIEDAATKTASCVNNIVYGVADVMSDEDFEACAQWLFEDTGNEQTLEVAVEDLKYILADTPKSEVREIAKWAKKNAGKGMWAINAIDNWAHKYQKGKYKRAKIAIERYEEGMEWPPPEDWQVSTEPVGNRFVAFNDEGIEFFFWPDNIHIHHNDLILLGMESDKSPFLWGEYYPDEGTIVQTSGTAPMETEEDPESFLETISYIEQELPKLSLVYSDYSDDVFVKTENGWEWVEDIDETDEVRVAKVAAPNISYYHDPREPSYRFPVFDSWNSFLGLCRFLVVDGQLFVWRAATYERMIPHGVLSEMVGEPEMWGYVEEDSNVQATWPELEDREVSIEDVTYLHKLFPDVPEATINYSESYNLSDGTKTAESRSSSDGVMIALVPPDEIRAAFEMEGGEPLDEQHITLTYLQDLSPEIIDTQGLIDDVENWYSDQIRPEGKPSGYGTFHNDDSHVLYAGWDIKGIDDLRSSLCHMLEEKGYSDDCDYDHGYQPHQTIIYEDEEIRELPSWPEGVDETVPLKVVVAVGDDWYEVTGNKELETIAVDFDGVLNSYVSGWTGPMPEDGPEEGAVAFIEELLEDYEVIIFSARASTDEGQRGIEIWLEENGFPPLEVTSEKPPASFYVDDNAVRYEGDFDDVREKLNKEADTLFEDTYKQWNDPVQWEGFSEIVELYRGLGVLRKDESKPPYIDNLEIDWSNIGSHWTDNRVTAERFSVVGYGYGHDDERDGEGLDLYEVIVVADVDLDNVEADHNRILAPREIWQRYNELVESEQIPSFYEYYGDIDEYEDEYNDEPIDYEDMVEYLNELGELESLENETGRFFNDDSEQGTHNSEGELTLESGSSINLKTIEVYQEGHLVDYRNMNNQITASLKTADLLSESQPISQTGKGIVTPDDQIYWWGGGFSAAHHLMIANTIEAERQGLDRDDVSLDFSEMFDLGYMSVVATEDFVTVSGGDSPDSDLDSEERFVNFIGEALNQGVEWPIISFDDGSGEIDIETEGDTFEAIYSISPYIAEKYGSIKTAESPQMELYRGIRVYADSPEEAIGGASIGWDHLGTYWSLDPSVAETFAKGTEGYFQEYYTDKNQDTSKTPYNVVFTAMVSEDNIEVFHEPDEGDWFLMEDEEEVTLWEGANVQVTNVRVSDEKYNTLLSEDINRTATATLKFAESQQVEEKAQKIYDGGGVKFISATPDSESGVVTYDFDIKSTSGSTYSLYGDADLDDPSTFISWDTVACQCPWGVYNYDRANEFEHLSHLFCAHALSAQKWIEANGQQETDKALEEMEQPEEDRFNRPSEPPQPSEMPSEDIEGIQPQTQQPSPSQTNTEPSQQTEEQGDSMFRSLYDETEEAPEEEMPEQPVEDQEENQEEIPEDETEEEYEERTNVYEQPEEDEEILRRRGNRIAGVSKYDDGYYFESDSISGYTRAWIDPEGNLYTWDFSDGSNLGRHGDVIAALWNVTERDPEGLRTQAVEQGWILCENHARNLIILGQYEPTSQQRNSLLEYLNGVEAADPRPVDRRFQNGISLELGNYTPRVRDITFSGLREYLEGSTTASLNKMAQGELPDSPFIDPDTGEMVFWYEETMDSGSKGWVEPDGTYYVWGAASSDRMATDIGDHHGQSMIAQEYDGQLWSDLPEDIQHEFYVESGANRRDAMIRQNGWTILDCGTSGDDFMAVGGTGTQEQKDTVAFLLENMRASPTWLNFEFKIDVVDFEDKETAQEWLITGEFPEGFFDEEYEEDLIY